MKISKSLEQATFVLLMLALQKEHWPIKSIVFSQRLGVSDSYLKKVLRKLVVAGFYTPEQLLLMRPYLITVKVIHLWFGQVLLEVKII